VVRAPMLLQAISVLVDVVCAVPVLTALCGRKGGYLDCIWKKQKMLKFLVTCNGVSMKTDWK